MIVGAASEGPVVFALRLFDGEIVDAGVAMMHDAVFVELPVLVAIGAVPVAGVVVALVGEAYGDARSVEGPELFDEAIVEFAFPLSGEEGDDLCAAVDEICAVAPLAVDRITEGDFFGIARVPIVFCFAHLGGGGFTIEWRDQVWLGLRAHCSLLAFASWLCADCST